MPPGSSRSTGHVAKKADGAFRQIWVPLSGVTFGDRVAGEWRRLAGWIGLSALTFALGFAVTIFGAPEALLPICVVSLAGLLGGGFSFASRIRGLSREMGRIIRSFGVEIDADPPLRSPALFHDWLTANHLSSEEVAAWLEAQEPRS